MHRVGSVAAALAAIAAAAAAACSGHGAGGAPGGDASVGGDGAGAIDGSADAPAPLCVNDASVDGAYPAGPTGFAIGTPLPDLVFDGAADLPDGGAPRTIALHDWFEPCAAASRLLVVRVGAAWCGTCRWTVGHTQELVSKDFGARLTWLDLLVGDADDAPATPTDLAAWRARIDAPTVLAVDPTYRLNAVHASRAPLPLVLLVDTRTMVLEDVLDDPDPQLLEIHVRLALAALDGAPAPDFPAPERFDGIFRRNQWDMIHDMTLPAAPPADPTSAVADDARAAAFGATLFADAALSPSGRVSCASCHRPAEQFQDGAPQSHDGVAPADRNAPSIVLAAHARWQFWDGRADTLWAQALGPIENASEFGSSRLFVAHAVDAKYKATYEAIFGALPPLGDAARFPAAGKPGDAAWDAMATADRDAVTRVFVGVGKSIAAYERTLRVQPNALDRYVAGDLGALTDAQKHGLFTFFDAGCAQCHYGPRLTDDAFHDVRFPTGRRDGAADRGRIDGIAAYAASEFRAGGPWSDAPSAARAVPVAVASALGQFKTPTLRGVASTAPFGHGGTLATLADVAKNYGNAGVDDASPLAVGPSDPWLPEFSADHADALVPFLAALTGDPVAPP